MRATRDNGTGMSDDTNYTIIDEDEDQPVLLGDDAQRPRSRELVIAIVLLALGLVVIALAAWCATAQVSSFSSDGGFSRSAAWVTALTLPLSIAGALFLVAGVIVGMARYWQLGRDVPASDSQVQPDAHAEIVPDELGA